jgi:hypothetical protein
MRKQIAFGLAAVLGAAFVGIQAGAPVAAQAPVVAPIVFQAAGPNVASIQSMVDAFRAALGGVNNGNVAGPLADGRREINWDGGGSVATSPAPTPFDGFLVNRGGRFTTPGSGFVQAPVDGLATTFANPSYLNIFQAFSPVRLFSSVGSNITDSRFFVPGGGELPATTKGFGAVFSDVDTQVTKAGEPGARLTPTVVFFYGADGKLLHRAVVPASQGDASLSFLGVVFNDARIGRVRIRAGSVAPGANDTPTRDIVMMDDFIYGEPQAVQGPAALRMLDEADAEDAR